MIKLNPEEQQKVKQANITFDEFLKVNALWSKFIEKNKPATSEELKELRQINKGLNALIDNMSTSAPNLLDILSNHSNELDVAFKEIISGQELNSEQREQLISLVDRRGNGSFKNFALNSLEQVIKEISQEIKLLNEELNDLEKGKTIQPSKLRKEFTCGVYASMVAGGLVSLNPVGFGLAVAAVGAAILDGC